MFIYIVLSNIHAILKTTQMAGYCEQLDTSMSCVLIQTTLLNNFLVKKLQPKTHEISEFTKIARVRA